MSTQRTNVQWLIESGNWERLTHFNWVGRSKAFEAVDFIAVTTLRGGNRTLIINGRELRPADFLVAKLSDSTERQP